MNVVSGQRIYFLATERSVKAISALEISVKLVKHSVADWDDTPGNSIEAAKSRQDAAETGFMMCC